MNKIFSLLRYTLLGDNITETKSLPCTRVKVSVFCCLFSFLYIRSSVRGLYPCLIRLEAKIIRICSTVYKRTKIPALSKARQQETAKRFYFRVHRMLIRHAGRWENQGEREVVMTILITTVSNKNNNINITNTLLYTTI